jgi:hypothetical protein
MDRGGLIWGLMDLDGFDLDGMCQVAHIDS